MKVSSEIFAYVCLCLFFLLLTNFKQILYFHSSGKYQKISAFLMFSGGIEIAYSPEMSQGINPSNSNIPFLYTLNRLENI